PPSTQVYTLSLHDALPISRPLYLAVEQVLWQLQVPLVGSPTLAALIALSVTGLILLSARPTQTRLARHLPGRAHDALNRSLRTRSEEHTSELQSQSNLVCR